MAQAIRLKIEFHRNLKIQTPKCTLLDIWTSKPIWKEWLDPTRRAAQSTRTPGVANQAEARAEIISTPGRSTSQTPRRAEAEALQVQASRTSRQRPRPRSYLSIWPSLHNWITWCSWTTARPRNLTWGRSMSNCWLPPILSTRRELGPLSTRQRTMEWYHSKTAPRFKPWIPREKRGSDQAAVPTPRQEELQLEFNSELPLDRIQVINLISETKTRLPDRAQQPRNTIICYFLTNTQWVQDNIILEEAVIILRSKASLLPKMLNNRSK